MLVIGVRACAVGIRAVGGYTCPCATRTGHHPPTLRRVAA